YSNTPNLEPYALLGCGESTEVRYVKFDKQQFALKICKEEEAFNQECSDNVLVHNDRILISDFNASTTNNDTSTLIVKGRLAYTAPECYLYPDRKIIKDKCDIYSLGMILWELTSKTPPFSGLPLLDIPLTLIKEGGEKDINGTPVYYAKIYRNCWQSEPEKRPTLNEILIKLKNLWSIQLIVLR
ncbi:22316_t:CDS:2, partial [Racocetra persica]